jgi:hypothetical protein
MEMGNFDDQDANYVPMLLMMMMKMMLMPPNRLFLIYKMLIMMIMMLIILIVILPYIENLVELQQLMHADAAIRLFLI